MQPSLAIGALIFDETYLWYDEEKRLIIIPAFEVGYLNNFLNLSFVSSFLYSNDYNNTLYSLHAGINLIPKNNQYYLGPTICFGRYQLHPGPDIAKYNLSTGVQVYYKQLQLKAVYGWNFLAPDDHHKKNVRNVQLEIGYRFFLKKRTK